MAASFNILTQERVALLSAYTLKILAVVTMLIDHAAYVLWLSGQLGGAVYTLMRAVGRISFVLFAFLLVNGMEKTSNPRRYFTRVVLFAVISQVPFSMAFSRENYAADAVTAAGFSVSFYPAWTLALLGFGIWLAYFGCVCRWKPDWSLLAVAAALVLPYMSVSAGGYTLIGSDLSIFYTLAISMALCLSASKLIEAIKARDGGRPAALLFLAALAAGVLVQPLADYGLFGLLLIASLYLARSNRAAQCVIIALWCILEYYFKLHSMLYALCAMLALIPIALYNGERGHKMGLGFYLVYPVHLCIFSLIGFALSR